MSFKKFWQNITRNSLNCDDSHRITIKRLISSAVPFKSDSVRLLVLFHIIIGFKTKYNLETMKTLFGVNLKYCRQLFLITSNTKFIDTKITVITLDYRYNHRLFFWRERRLFGELNTELNRFLNQLKDWILVLLISWSDREVIKPEKLVNRIVY